MMNLKSYDLVKKISSELFGISNSGGDVLSELEAKATQISKTICQDFYEITRETVLPKNIIYYYEDEDYRQSATGCILKAYFEKEPDVLVRFECLIDFNRIFVSINGETQTDGSIKSISNKIRSKYNSEDNAELSDLVKTL